MVPCFGPGGGVDAITTSNSLGIIWGHHGCDEIYRYYFVTSPMIRNVRFNIGCNAGFMWGSSKGGESMMTRGFGCM